jgi:hypothetical protein
MCCAIDLAVDEPHDEEHVPGDLVGAMNRHDVLIQRTGGSRFAQKRSRTVGSVARCGGSV